MRPGLKRIPLPVRCSTIWICRSIYFTLPLVAWMGGTAAGWGGQRKDVISVRSNILVSARVRNAAAASGYWWLVRAGLSLSWSVLAATSPRLSRSWQSESGLMQKCDQWTQTCVNTQRPAPGTPCRHCRRSHNTASCACVQSSRRKGAGDRR